MNDPGDLGTLNKSSDQGRAIRVREEEKNDLAQFDEKNHGWREVDRQRYIYMKGSWD